jgi:hypothetical protein
MRFRYFATNPPAPTPIGVYTKLMNRLRRAGTLRHKVIKIICGGNWLRQTRSAAMNRKILLSMSLCLCVFVAIPQSSTKKLKEFSTEPVSKVSIDRLGNFYLVLEKGIIKKYDTDGNFMNEFANPGGNSITLVEPWNPLRVFVYYREQQKIVLLDHHLEVLQSVSIDPSLAVEPYLVSPSVNNFWILDKADYSLKKIEFKTSRVLEEVSAKLVAGAEHDFTFLREYQNQLFLIDQKSGIDILSNLGKAIHTFPLRNARYLGFLGQEFYYLENGTVHFYDLYTEDRHDLAVDPSAQFVLLTDERMVLIKKGTVEVWEYKP